jgi:competence protein ComGC
MRASVPNLNTYQHDHNRPPSVEALLAEGLLLRERTRPQ